jgi:hypothetical protein
MATKRRDLDTEPDNNRDPITGEPGAHPVGVGIGTAAGGAAAGALGGAAAGPAGTVVGAVAGGVAGAFAGKSAAESIDPTAEDVYWRANHMGRPYYDKNMSYEDYQPAYRSGWESRSRYPGRSYQEIEPEIERSWERVKSKSRLSWDKAKHAVRDAWDRLDHNVDGR